MSDGKLIPPYATGKQQLAQPTARSESIGGRLYATPVRLASLFVFVGAGLVLLLLQWSDLGGLSNDQKGYLVIGCLVAMGGAALVNRIARITGN